jgi:hypothetical protein
MGNLVAAKRRVGRPSKFERWQEENWGKFVGDARQVMHLLRKRPSHPGSFAKLLEVDAALKYLQKHLRLLKHKSVRWQVTASDFDVRPLDEEPEPLTREQERAWYSTKGDEDFSFELLLPLDHGAGGF